MMDGNPSNRTPTTARDTSSEQELKTVSVYDDTDQASKTGVNDWSATESSTSTHDASSRSPEDIERNIEQTQERIAENIDELTKRLNPTHIKDQAVQSLNDSLNLGGLKHLLKDVQGSLSTGAKSSGVKILEGVKHNPMSSALMGVGVGIVALGGVLAARTDPSHSYKARTNKSNMRTYDERLRGMMEAVENKHNGSHEEHSSGVSGKLQSAKTVVSDKAHQAKEATLHGAQVAKEGFGRALEAQPLAIGAVALLAGLAIGLLLPRTSYEDSLMGERSDQLISQAKGKANEVVQTAKGTVNDVLQTAKETAKDVVQTTKDAAKEAVNV
jgi:gas vesicle protein